MVVGFWQFQFLYGICSSSFIAATTSPIVITDFYFYNWKSLNFQPSKKFSIKSVNKIHPYFYSKNRKFNHWKELQIRYSYTWWNTKNNNFMKKSRTRTFFSAATTLINRIQFIIDEYQEITRKILTRWKMKAAQITCWQHCRFS